MAIDIILAKSDQPIKNGTVVVSCPRTGFPSAPPATLTYDAFVTNTPTISDIESKYDNKFDNPSYYYGGSTDGGDIV